LSSNNDIRFLQNPGHEKALRGAEVRAGLPAMASPIQLSAGDLLLPAPVNAHDHGYGIRTLDFGSLDDALETWIPTMRLRPRTDPYLEALVAFSRLASTGVGATIHCHNSLNAARLVDEALEVIRAAGDVGIRLGLSCPLLDHDPWAYDGGPSRLKPFMAPQDWDMLSPMSPRYLPVEDQIAAADAVAAANSNPLADVQYGPVGPQWCSNALLEAVAEASAASRRRIHMHLLESPRQRVWLDRRFPQGIVRYLDDIGFLSPRLAVAHGVQMRADEYELLTERGVQLVSNPSANLRLRSGTAPLADPAMRGLRFAIGLDGSAFDDDQDLWREMRLLYFLHGGRQLERGFTAADVFDAAIHTGRTVVNAPAEDFTVIDYAALIADSVFDDLDEAEVLLNRMSARHAKAVHVAGRPVMQDGRLLNVDFEAARLELLTQAKADLPRLTVERERCAKLITATRAYYSSWTLPS
jgi:cytosine/adenosine deaminase-related metal-dependent hydrolase